MSELKTKINDAISEHIDIGNSYTYQLIRTKEAFQYGTVTLDDFIEWDDDAVEELSNDIMKALQPKLNENQEIVLEWLKVKYQMGGIELFTLLWRLHVNSKMKKFKERPIYVGFRNLSDKEQAQVLQAFATWALDQC